ncbi:MAG: hypothetical protein A2145_03700 [candidate division Zixibacteria bacterium RBG_16_40_9]|nr:MAG: hypothetical protein A2145_03700 [candidate division Zixibacteria bacterium RBG_16_40_9]
MLGIKFQKKVGIMLSHPVSLIFLFIYLIQTGVLAYLLVEKFNKENQIKLQEKRILELEEKLKIFKIIEDFQVGLNTDEIGELTSVIYRESQMYNYDPLLIIALIQTESSFKRNQQSHRGAMGLMQLRPFVGYDVAKKKGLNWQGKVSLFDPDFNIQLGSLYLFELILKFRDVKKAIIAYNFGENALRLRIKQGGDLPKIFLTRVVNNYKKLKEKYAKITL